MRIRDCTSSSLGILVRLIQSVHLRGGHGSPIIAWHQIVVVYKGLSGVICQFVLQDDQTGRFWTLIQRVSLSPVIERWNITTGQPFMHIATNLGLRRSVTVQ